MDNIHLFEMDISRGFVSILASILINDNAVSDLSPHLYDSFILGIYVLFRLSKVRSAFSSPPSKVELMSLIVGTIYR